jgi:hypothetical protein
MGASEMTPEMYDAVGRGAAGDAVAQALVRDMIFAEGVQDGFRNREGFLRCEFWARLAAIQGNPLDGAHLGAILILRAVECEELEIGARQAIAIEGLAILSASADEGCEGAADVVNIWGGLLDPEVLDRARRLQAAIG